MLIAELPVFIWNFNEYGTWAWRVKISATDVKDANSLSGLFVQYAASSFNVSKGGVGALKSKRLPRLSSRPDQSGAISSVTLVNVDPFGCDDLATERTAYFLPVDLI